VGLSAAVAAIVVLIGAAPASAATPFNAGIGSAPSVAVGADGVGHVVWETGGAGELVGYCRVPKNGTACDVPTTTLVFPSSTTPNGSDHPQVFAPAPNKVVVVAGCADCGAGGTTYRLYRWTSATNGSTFGPAIEIANNLQMTGQGAHVDSGDFTIGIGGRTVLAGPPLFTTPAQILPVDHEFSSSLVAVPGGSNQLVAASSSLGAVSFTVFPNIVPAALTSANVNIAGNWTGAQSPTPTVVDRESSLGAGGAGVFLAFTRVVASGTDQIIVQQYVPLTKSFAAPLAIEGPSTIDDASPDFGDVRLQPRDPIAGMIG